MVRHVVAADNSCLFHAVSACLASSAQAVDGGAPALRRRVVAHMLARPAEYSAAVLGQPPEAYAAQMLGSAAWGGALECRALAELLAVQLAVADIRTAALFVYCEERAFARRMFLLYDGVHYDALFAASGTRLFGPSDAAAAAAAVEVADALRREHAFTDTAHFSLACSACGILVAGTAEAQAHAEATGHGSFVERRPPAA